MSPITILNLQYFQELHDRRYHVDIYSKSLMDRLRHLHQHLIKYSSSELKRQSHYQDAFACILSMANALNVSLEDSLTRSQQKTVRHLDDIQYKYHKDILLSAYQAILGNIAKTLEGFDHVESLKYKEELKANITEALIVLLQMREELDDMTCYSLEREYINRIFDLKKKHIFYAMYHVQDLTTDQIYVTFQHLKDTL